MNTIEIPRNEWVSFFNKFNKENRDKIISMMAINDEGYVVDSAERLPFAGIEINPHDAENTVVQFAAGEVSATTLATTFIDKVDKIVLEETDNGDPKKLYIISSLGRSGEIKFHNMEET
jgi:hypothetical protein